LTLRIVFDNSYARLPERFYARVKPTPVAQPRLVKLNRSLARMLGLDADALDTPAGAAIFAGNAVPEGAEPIAQAYAGHQFGSFVPQLGDGRAVLLGEVIDRKGGRRDIQLKGSGPTPFSRRGDGRAAIGPVLREYLVSEAMAAMGIPTTRALAAATTGEPVYRETALPGAVVTRVAASHVRVGTFQYFAARQDVEAIRLLADHVIERHYPETRDAEQPYFGLFEGVVARQAELVAAWMAVGFIHGVMNTDNTSIAGETIDYGPCAFMDAYHPSTVFSSIDQMGRYAFANQAGIAQWNLVRLAECLLPLLAEGRDAAIEAAQEALKGFGPRFERALNGRLAQKIGLSEVREGDVELVRDLLAAMAANAADWTLTFRRLADAAEGSGDEPVRSLFIDPTAFDAWAVRWRERLGGEADSVARMRAVNPAFIPRNHRVEAVIRAAIEEDDFAPFEELLEVVTRPYEEQPGKERFAQPPAEHERVLQTFCGT
jgi:serine/tyrosine/threonine adenylyltransferase